MSFKGGWSKEATQQFCKMTDNKTLYMTVIREVNNVLHVDLSKPLLDNAKDEVPVSIRDALVFLELAQFITPESGNITGEPESGLMGGDGWLLLCNHSWAKKLLAIRE